MARSKVKSTSHPDVAHLHPLTYDPTTHQLPSPYTFRDITWTRFTTQGHCGKVKGQIKVTLGQCIPTPSTQCPYQGSTSYNRTVSEIQPGQTFSR